MNIDLLSEPSPDAVRLATVLSVATRIEPGLLRAARLRLFPRMNVGAEADLWASDWVAHRGPSYLVLRPEILPRLRAALRDLLSTARSQGRSLPVWEIVSTAHTDMSPALLLEERLTWLAISGQGDRAVLGRELGKALHALVVEDRKGIAEWAVGAWRRLPPEVLATTTAWQLASVAGQYAPLRPAAGSAADVTMTDVEAISAALSHDTELRVLWQGDQLYLGAPHGPGVTAIAVPDTDPRIIEVEYGADERQPVHLHDGEIVSVPVGAGPVTIRTSRGDLYAPDQVTSDDLITGARPNLWADTDFFVDPRLRSGEQGDLDELVESLRDESPAELADALLHRYDLTADLGSLQEAIVLLRNALAADPADESTLHLLLVGALIRRFHSDGDRAGLGEAIDLARHALSRLAPESSNLSAHLTNLAVALDARYEVMGLPADLDEAIGALSRAVDLLPTHHPDAARVIANLAGLLETRARRSGNHQDLDAAIRMLDTAAEISTDEGPWLATVLSGLGKALCTRFRVLGRRDDLDRAVPLHRRAAALAGAGPMSGLLVANLSDALRLRYLASGAISDLTEAITAARDALALAPQDPDERAVVTLRLAATLQSLFEATGDLTSLNEAIHRLRQVADQPAELPRQGEALSSLSAALLLRHQATAAPEDLDEAVHLGFRTVALFRDGQPAFPRTTANLAAALLTRYQLHNDQQDLAAAADLADRAVAASHREAEVLSVASAVHAVRHESFGETADFDTALSLWKHIVDDDAAPLPVRLDAAAAANGLAIYRSQWEHALTFAEKCLTLLALDLPARGSLVLGPDHLERYAGVAHDGAACALMLGRPERAVELLEQARSSQWSRLLDLWTDLSRLQQAHPALAERLALIRAQLDAPTGPDDDWPSDIGHELSGSWAQAIAEVRAIPGFSSFLAPWSFAQLAGASAGGPVVVINISRVRSDALIIERQDVRVVPLPDADPETMRPLTTEYAASRDLAGGRRPPLRSSTVELLQRLWSLIVRPVMDHLVPRQSVRPRVWWCPTKVLAGLPLHAARSNDSNALDLVCSSYTPSLRILVEARARSVVGTTGSSAQRTLIVADPRPGSFPLEPLAAAREEALMVQQNMAHTTLLAEHEATRATVLALLAEHHSLHFIGHGVADPSQPANSGLALADGLLTVAEFARLRRPPAGLAFLSACFSGSSGFASRDEAWTPAVALHIAGFRDVIGVADVVTDREAAELARVCYEQLARGVHPAEALNRALRSFDARDFPLVIGFFHIGP
ncbi:CHAT domain-containing protein [Streptomyces sp. NPDC006527]|uniref:CHAT domain-containing protein n=1 Tax=Streptomyces sp. NPDC006527 TaxID=3364749 RepID=UPI0036A9AE9F